MATGLSIENCAKRLFSPTRLFSQNGRLQMDSNFHSQSTRKISSTKRKLLNKDLRTYIKNTGKHIIEFQNKYANASVENVATSTKIINKIWVEYRSRFIPVVRLDSYKVQDKSLVSFLYVSPRMKTMGWNLVENFREKLHVTTKSTESTKINTTVKDSKQDNTLPVILQSNTDKYKIVIKDDHNSQGPAENTSSESVDAEQITGTINVCKGYPEDRDIPREQHGFLEAMTHQNESIVSYTKTEDDSHPSTVDVKTVSSVTITNSKFTNPLPKLQNVLNRIPNKIYMSKTVNKTSQKIKQKSKAVIETKTRSLCQSVKIATTITSRFQRLEDLCNYIHLHPEARGVIYEEKIIPVLLTWRSQMKDIPLQKQINEGLAVLGYANPVNGRGIRVLCVDGGGIRGLVALKILQEIEQLSGRSINELFDYVSGVSTGSLLEALIFVAKKPLNEVEEIYKDCSKKVFGGNKVRGTYNLIRTDSYYNSELWEEVLKNNIGERTFRDAALDLDCPKISAISAIDNTQKYQNYLFRNYNYPQGVASHYKGSMKYKLWEAVKASSAAPTYFEKCRYDTYTHVDGGVINNNPTAIAIHECKLLWPRTPLHCVISIGTGRFEPWKVQEDEDESSRLSDTISTAGKVVQSATDTEGTHKTVEDLLPQSTYYRFNPYISQKVKMDEVREEHWLQMYKDTETYCVLNKPKLEKAAYRLTQRKTIQQTIVDKVQVNLKCMQ